MPRKRTYRIVRMTSQYLCYQLFREAAQFLFFITRMGFGEEHAVVRHFCESFPLFTTIAVFMRNC